MTIIFYITALIGNNSMYNRYDYQYRKFCKHNLCIKKGQNYFFLNISGEFVMSFDSNYNDGRIITFNK